MPASSRKRNKGKERKAKREAVKAEAIRADANRIWRRICNYKRCNHGCDVATISNDHPVSSFMDQFYINLHYKGMTVGQTLREIFKTHTQIWKNGSHKNIVLDILVCIGTNMLLCEGTNVSSPIIIVQSILVLEHYVGTNDNIVDSVNSRAVKSTLRNLECDVSSIKRDLLKFFRKRKSCKCLKRLHLDARKSTPKLGTCYGCDEEMERVLLDVCSRCMIMPYCSRECQIAAWPEHERRCDVYVEANRTRGG